MKYVNAVTQWWGRRRRFTRELDAHFQKEKVKDRKVRLACRYISGLADHSALRIVAAYGWTWSGVYVTLDKGQGASDLQASNAIEALRRRLVREGYEVTLDRSHNGWTKTQNLSLEVEGLPGLGTVEVKLSHLGLGPDCVIEERRVEELVEYQPEVDEYYAEVSKRVAVCTDPVTGEQTETVLG